VIPVAQQLEATAARGLSGREMEVVKRALKKMYDNLAHAPAQRGKRRARSTAERSAAAGPA
jgi:hypothetical protein